MSDVKFFVDLATPLTLGASGGWKTLILFQTPANQRSKVTAWGLFPKGTVNSDPAIEARLIKCSTLGTGGAATTPQRRSAGSETVQKTSCLTATAGSPFTVEPTISGTALDSQNAHPQKGEEWPAIDEEGIPVAGGEIIALQYRNDSGGAAIPCGASLSMEQ